MDITIPERLASTILEVHGAAGRAWLDRLPGLLVYCREHWGLRIGQPLSPLTYNLLLGAWREDGSEVVLKLGVPHRELATEAVALQIFEGHGAVLLLDADPERGALLLERCSPGGTLLEIDDEEQSTSIAISVMRQLWHPAPEEHPFPTVTDWAAGLHRLRERFGGASGPLPARLVARGEDCFEALLGSMAESVVLHGDLHYENILSAQRQPWLAIDPKGVVGEPAYEVGALLRNPIPRLLAAPDPHALIERRVDHFAEGLEIDRSRILRWGLAQAVLSAWWSIEDHGYGWEAAIACAEILADLV